MSLSHERAQYLLDLSLHQELDPADRADLAEHLASCPECRANQASLEALDTRLRQALPARLPAYSLSQAEINTKARKISQKVKPKMAAQKLTQLLRPAASLAAILLLVAGLSWIFNSFAPRPVPGQETATASAPDLSKTLPVVVGLTETPSVPIPESTSTEQPGQIPMQILPDSLSWDPTGQWLAYRDSRGGVWLIRYEPQEEHRFVLPGVQDPANLQTAWSPDGSKILVFGTWGFDYPQTTGIWLVPVNSQGAGPVEEILPPSEARAPVYQNEGQVYAAAWSPDGNELAYTYQGEAWLYGIAERQSRRLTHLTENGLHQVQGSETFDGVRDVIWSPDGQRLALELTCNCPSPWTGVGLVDLTSQEVRLLADGGNQISWAPGGEKVAFRNASGDWASGYTFDFYTVDLDGGGITNITNSNPRWDPYLSAPDTYQDSDYQTTSLKWGPNGRYLYETQSFNPDRLQAHSFIVRADPETIAKEFMSDSREQAWQVFPTWLVDGRLVYLVVDPVSPDPADPDLYRLRRIEIEGETAQEWGAELIFRSMAWAPDGSALAMLLPPDSHGQPERIQFIILK